MAQTFPWDSWFTGPMCYSATMEGNRCDALGMTLGMAIGERMEVPAALLHEMGHFIEIDDARTFQTGFGLRYPDREHLATCRGILRECRVAAIQSVLAKLFNVDGEIVDTVESFRYLLPDWPVAFRHFGVNDQNDSTLCEKLLHYVHQLSASYTPKGLRAEWDRKISLWAERCLEQAKIIARNEGCDLERAEFLRKYYSNSFAKLMHRRKADSSF